MRTALLSLTFLLAGSMAAPAFAHTAAPKKKVTATTKKGKILPMKEYIDQLMAKMTLQEKIGQLNLMVAGDITTGGALDTQVGSDIAQGNMGGVFNIKGLDKIKALQEIAIKNSRRGIPLLVGMDVIHGYETMFLLMGYRGDEEGRRSIGQGSKCRRHQLDFLSYGRHCTRCPLGTNKRRKWRGSLSERRDGSSDDSGLPGRGYAHRRDSESQPHHGLSEAFCPVRRR